MREAFREFRTSLPGVVAYWMGIGLPLCLIISLLDGQSFGEAVATTAALVVGVGLPMLGPIWARYWPKRRTWAAFRFALLWFGVFALPGILVGALLNLGVRRMFGE
jgi:hypothetical protein